MLIFTQMGKLKDVLSWQYKMWNMLFEKLVLNFVRVDFYLGSVKNLHLYKN